MRGRPKKPINEHNVRVNISLDPAVHKSAKDFAKGENKSLSKIINDKLKELK